MLELERAPRGVLAAIATTSCAVLVLQLSLTRLLSATIDYHFAFLVLALVMLGLAGSAMASLRFRDLHGNLANLHRASLIVTIGGVSASVGVFAYVHLGWLGMVTGATLAPVAIGVLAFSGTFWCAGYLVATLLDSHSADISRVYWFDLVGAAFGCLLAIGGLTVLRPMEVILACGVAFAASGVLLSQVYPSTRERQLAVGASAALTALLVLACAVPDLLRVRFAKGVQRDDVLWEAWNPQSRVTVSAEVAGGRQALAMARSKGPVDDAEADRLMRLWSTGWGTSRNYAGHTPDTRWIEIDSAASTQIVERGAELGPRLDFLEWDVTAIAYHLRRDRMERVFIIGGGGCRDVLTALHFGAHNVDVVEINPAVVGAVQGQFGDFSGRPYARPDVHLHLGEGRQQLSRTNDRFDLLQMSMVDTWAASMAGALVLSENGLYTREAFALYVSRLSDDGLLSVSRWYSEENWGESARLLRLEGMALKDSGVQHPEDNVIVVVNRGYMGTAVETAIASKTAFSEADLATLRAVAADKGYEVVWPTDAPRGPMDVRALLSDPDLSHPIYDLSVPTDQRPFYFSDRNFAGSWVEALRQGDFQLGSVASLLLAQVFSVLSLVGALIVVVPLGQWIAAAPGRRPPNAAMVYFGGIGAGFMFTEIALVQRYIVFLGHPTYALSVVLFVLLIASGTGSGLVGRVADGDVARMARVASGLVVTLLLATALVVPQVLLFVTSWQTPARIALAAGLVAPLALALGTIYPLGVRMLRASGHAAIVPGLWGVNGLAGVLASVGGMMIAMGAGYSAVLLVAMVCYGATFFAIRGLAGDEVR